MIQIRLLLALPILALAQADAQTATTSPIGLGWAQTSINTAIFRKNSIASHGDTQYVAYYDPDGHVTLAKRQLDSDNWLVQKTEYTGNVLDAHNSISIAVDGDGYLHMSWDHHGNELRYCRSTAPGSLELTSTISMTGENELNVTYPEFFSIASGDLLFLYRDGESGRGNLIMNRYDRNAGTWRRIQTNLIDGEQQRNAYWQVCADPLSETIHVSWVWRETWDVSTNHDISYAVSTDGGETWSKSSGEPYHLPITIENAEIAWRVSQNSELINQTSMFADRRNRPYIASYWTPPGETIPQFHIVYHDGEKWSASQVGKRKTPFSLSGGGTKRIPISRPQIFADTNEETLRAYIVFRDEERHNRPSIAICDDLEQPHWRIEDLSRQNLGQWEPSYDIHLWQRQKTLHLFTQKTGQGDGESVEALPPQIVSILQWRPAAAQP